MPMFTDQLGCTIELKSIPKRIVSLVPSQTELLFDLGLNEEVTGITKFCVHPDQWFRNKTRIGGTKNIKKDLVRSLQPDLIIANKEENVKEQVEALQKFAPVWTSDINNMESALQMIKCIGEITGRTVEATAITASIRKKFEQYSCTDQSLRTAYLIWKDPYMTAGGDTFISDMLSKAGFINVFEDMDRYPKINIDELEKRNTELVLLSSEPYPFRQKHIDELRSSLPDIRIELVDGEMFSWYGSRMKYAAAYIQELRKKINESFKI